MIILEDNLHFHYLATHEALHKGHYDLHVKFCQMSHWKIALTNKLLFHQFQYSFLVDEVDALRSMVMDLKLHNNAPGVSSEFKEVKDERDFNINKPSSAKG